MVEAVPSKNAKQVDEYLASKYNVALIKHDAFASLEKQGSRLAEAKIDDVVFRTPIEEVS